MNDHDTLLLLEQFRPEIEAVLRYTQQTDHVVDRTAIIIVQREYPTHDGFVASLTPKHEKTWQCAGGVVFPCVRSFARSSVCEIAREGASHDDADDLARYFDETPRGYAVVVFLGELVRLARTRARPAVRAMA